jgi:hypothetical protein
MYLKDYFNECRQEVGVFEPLKYPKPHSCIPPLLRHKHGSCKPKPIANIKNIKHIKTASLFIITDVVIFIVMERLFYYRHLYKAIVKQLNLSCNKEDKDYKVTLERLKTYKLTTA